MKSGYISEIFASFQGEGAWVGRRHLFVRMAGCNLRCVYCDTPESLVPTDTCRIYVKGGAQNVANPITPFQLDEYLREFLGQEQGFQAMAITGGEPLVQVEFLRGWLSRTPVRLPVLLETNGMLPRQLASLLSWVDMISMDVKLPSNSGEKAFWQEHEEFLRLSRAKQIYVKMVVDQTTRAEEVETGARMVASVGKDIPLYLQPLVTFPDGRLLVTAERLEIFYSIASRHLAEVRVLPQTHKILGVR